MIQCSLSESDLREKKKLQIKEWIGSVTDSESTKVREPEKIKFPLCVQLLAACSNSDLEEFSRLLNLGTDINTQNADGLTSTHLACINVDFELLQFLINNNANINIQDHEGWTPLHAAASVDCCELARLLIEHGADLSVLSADNELAIDVAQDEEMINLLRDAMKKQDLNPDEVKRSEELALLHDAEHWLETGQYKAVLDSRTGATPLHVAACKNYVKVIEILLKIPGVDINAKDIDGWTPLHAAAHWNQEAAARLLTSAGASFDEYTRTNQSIIDVADKEMVVLLRLLREKQRTDRMAASKRPEQLKVTDQISSEQNPQTTSTNTKINSSPSTNNADNSKSGILRTADMMVTQGEETKSSDQSNVVPSGDVKLKVDIKLPAKANGVDRVSPTSSSSSTSGSTSSLVEHEPVSLTNGSHLPDKALDLAQLNSITSTIDRSSSRSVTSIASTTTISAISDSTTRASPDTSLGLTTTTTTTTTNASNSNLVDRNLSMTSTPATTSTVTSSSTSTSVKCVAKVDDQKWINNNNNNNNNSIEEKIRPVTLAQKRETNTNGSISGSSQTLNGTKSTKGLVLNHMRDNLKSTENSRISPNTEDVSNTRRVSVVMAPTKSGETETQRSVKARYVRSTRRSTQGVTSDDVEQAKMLIDKNNSAMASTSALSNNNATIITTIPDISNTYSKCTNSFNRKHITADPSGSSIISSINAGDDNLLGRRPYTCTDSSLTHSAILSSRKLANTTSEADQSVTNFCFNHTPSTGLQNADEQQSNYMFKRKPLNLHSNDKNSFTDPLTNASTHRTTLRDKSSFDRSASLTNKSSSYQHHQPISINANECGSDYYQRDNKAVIPRPCSRFLHVLNQFESLIPTNNGKTNPELRRSVKAIQSRIPQRRRSVSPTKLRQCSVESEDYKRLYTEEKFRRERLENELAEVNKEKVQLRKELLQLASRHAISNSTTISNTSNASATTTFTNSLSNANTSSKNSTYSSPLSNDNLQSRLFLHEDKVKELNRLREENAKMKEENSALIRVISKLSRPM